MISDPDAPDTDTAACVGRAAPAQGARLRVLIVEDEFLTALFATDILTALGHEVCAVAATVAEALSAAEACRPDLALLDINLGEGGDGVDLARLLSAAYGVPHFYTTAYGDPATLARAKATRPAGFVRKPYDEADLSRALDSLRRPG